MAKHKNGGGEEKKRLLDAVRNLDFLLFLNEVMEPVVVLPGDNEEMAWPVEHKRVKVWLVLYGQDPYVLNRTPEKKEIQEVIDWMCGGAYEVGVRLPDVNDPDNADLVDNDPIFVAVRAWMQEVKKVGQVKSILAREGYSDLKATAERSSDNMRLWPKDAASLSRRLLRADQQLLAFGLAFRVRHTSRGNWWDFKRVREWTVADFIEKDANKHKGKKKLEEEWDLPPEAWA